MSSSVTPEYARRFIQRRASGFRKDMAICLRGTRRKYHFDGDFTHAYFPALMTCLSFCEFLAGFNAGEIEAFGRGSVRQVKDFAADYLDQRRYSELKIDVLWEGFRNKMAHLAHPYFIFDTAINQRTLNHFGGRRMRITWLVSQRPLKRPLRLERKRGMPKTNPPPFPASYDHRLHISLPHLRSDLLQAADQYARDLHAGNKPIAPFEKALREMYAVP